MVDADGRERVGTSVSTPFAASPDGIDMAVADLERSLQRVIANLDEARGVVAAVGVAGMAESGAPLRAGEATGPIIAWHDGRGEETVASLETRFGRHLSRWTGRRLGTVSSVAKLGWLLDRGLPSPDRWLGVPELALWLLTGAQATEHSLAARTGAYDVTERRWLPEVLAHLRIHESVFAEVARAGSRMGSVSGAAARRFGLPSGVPVTIAGHDHLAAAAGLGVSPGDLLNSVGTAETLLRRVESPPDVDRALALDVAVTLWPGGDAWGVLASATRSGLVIDALAARLGVEPATLDEVPACAEPPAQTGERVDLGQGIEIAAGPPPEMWRATREALARRTAAAADRVAALTGPHRRLVVFGGGSRSPAWLREKESKIGVPVVRCPVAEATARGAALAGGVAAGWWPTPDAGPVAALGDPAPDRRAQP